MSVRIGVGDAVLVQIDDKVQPQRIGLIEYIGYIDEKKNKKYIGINLVEKVLNGHSGTIHGVQRFQCLHGHGVYVGIKNIIKKLNVSDLTINMQQIIALCKQRLDEYVAALSQRDEYIETLKDTARRLRKQINALRNHNSADSIPLHTIKELAVSPPPLDKSLDKSLKKSLKLKTNKHSEFPDFEIIEKHSEYTKYTESPKDNISSSDEWSDNDDEYDDEDEDDDDNDTYYDDAEVEWVDDVDYHLMEKRTRPTPISITTLRGCKQKSYSSHNTPISMRSYQTDNQNKPHSSHNTPISHSSSPYHLPRNHQYDQNMQKMYDIMSLSPHQQHIHQACIPFKTLSLTQCHYHPRLMAKRSNSLDCYDDNDAILKLKHRGHPLKLQRSLPQQLLHLPLNTYSDAQQRTQSVPSKQMQSAYFG